VTIGLAQQQRAAIRGDIAPLKVNLNGTSFTDWKLQRILGTVCHEKNPFFFQYIQLNYKEL